MVWKEVLPSPEPITFVRGFNPSYNWKWSGSAICGAAAGLELLGFNPSYNWKWSGSVTGARFLK